MTIQLEQFKIILRNNLVSSLGNIAVAFLFVLLSYQRLDLTSLVVWFGVITVLSLWRVFVGFNLQKLIKEDINFDLNQSIQHFYFIILFIAISWGGLSFLFVKEGMIAQHAIVVITIAGMTAASVSSLSAIKKYAITFVSFLALPLVIVFLTLGSSESLTFAFLFFVYYLFLIKTIKNNASNIEEMLALNLRNVQLIEDLTKEKQKAEFANQVKNQFLANMSHEIRTPMNSIIGFSELLKEKETQPEKLQFIRSIHKSSHHLLQVISDILDFTKLENNAISFEIKAFNVRKSLQSEIEYYLETAKEQNIQLDIDYDKAIPEFLSSDISRIKQVLGNLLSNAIKFSFSGSLVSVLVKYDQNNSELIVSVQDYGIGIPKHKQNNIFNAFTQADYSGTRKFGGTGLGLSISSAIVTALGGRIQLKSDEGQGSLFTFVIPASAEVALSPATDSQDKLEGNVLIVEDDKTNQLLLKRIFDKLGIDYEIANDGLEAVDAFRKKSFDLILMDENMPNKTGIEATHDIRQLEKELNRPHQKIIALTANALKGDRERFIDAGMDEYLSKPINIVHLKQVLSQFLRHI